MDTEQKQQVKETTLITSYYSKLYFKLKISNEIGCIQIQIFFLPDDMVALTMQTDCIVNATISSDSETMLHSPTPIVRSCDGKSANE